MTQKQYIHPNKQYIDAYVMGENLEFNWGNEDLWETLDEEAMGVERFEGYCRRLISRDQPVTGLSWRIKKKPQQVWIVLVRNKYDGRVESLSLATYPTKELAEQYISEDLNTCGWEHFATVQVTEGDGL